ncbi:MAG: hypothetical protein GY853_08385 [PVC group bacterium]|nr:hypothetical protein [PVC group bacterium]
MEGLFKFIFYGIIIVVWAISNAKKKGRWDDEVPDFSGDSIPPAKPRPKPVYQAPSHEGEIKQPSYSRPKPPSDKYSTAYEKKLAQRKKRLETLKTKQKPEPEQTPLPLYSEPKEKVKVNSQPFLHTSTKKKGYILQSPPKEGILWSIVLGSPRSKTRFDWTNPPIRK